MTMQPCGICFFVLFKTTWRFFPVFKSPQIYGLDLYCSLWLTYLGGYSNKNIRRSHFLYHNEASCNLQTIDVDIDELVGNKYTFPYLHRLLFFAIYIVYRRFSDTYTYTIYRFLSDIFV